MRKKINLFDEIYEDEALEFIKKHEPPEGYYVAFSGGKDSIVVYDLVKRSGVKHFVYYSCTGIDPPEVVHFIKQNYSEVIFVKPDESFYDGIIRHGLPTIFKRWCCRLLKEISLKKIPLANRIMGIREEESSKRKKRGRISTIKSQKVTHYKPIFHWNEYHIWDYIEKYNLKYPSLYDEGFNRIGCVVCPFHSSKEKEKYKSRWPYIFRAFEKKAHELYTIKDKGSFAGESFEEWLDYYYKNGFLKSNKEK
ncbi:MAG: phosphoadenosine phosphosulfate reductase family protein [Patescibacteria group bacterium]|jgi:phosphoadenosine phosphosulfate reductase